MSRRAVHLLCPLAVEARALRTIRGCVNAPIVVGPCTQGEALSGPAAWIAANGAHRAARGDMVILAGVAGSLRAVPRVGDAVVVEEVLDADGRTWRSDVDLPSGVPRAACLSVDVVADAPTKRRLSAEHPRAEIVDLESASFAEAAQRAGLRWLVVRGISDGIDDDLPPGVASWTTSDGATRIGAVVAALARRPALVPSVVRLGRRTASAMRAVRTLLEELLANDDAMRPRRR